MNKKIILLAIIIILFIFFALWILTCSGSAGMPPNENTCIQMGRGACSTYGELPSVWAGNWQHQVMCLGWNIRTSCQKILDCSSCEECGFL
jgi:hypothetical protein